MKGFIAFLVVVAIVVIALGFYQGWFHVATTDSSSNTKIQIDVHKQKIKEDEEKAKQKANEIKEKVKEKVNQTTK